MTKVEWDEWKTQEATKEWFKFLNKIREEIKEDWAQSIYTGPVGEETMQRNAYALGQAELLSRLQDATFESVEGGDE